MSNSDLRDAAKNNIPDQFEDELDPVDQRVIEKNIIAHTAAINESKLALNVNAGDTGVGNATLTVQSSVYFAIQNSDIINNLSFTIGTISITVAPQSSFEDYFEVFTSVAVSASGSYNWYTKGSVE